MINTMKTFFIWMIAGLCVCMNLSAQRGGGGGGRGGAGGRGGGNFGGGPGGPPPTATVSRDYEQVQIADFPEISGMDVDKKLKLFSIVKTERKNILKLMDQKQELQILNERSNKPKDIEKNNKNIAKLDEKIKKENLNTDKKIKSTLTNDQYKAFVEKKDQIKFNDPPVSGRRAFNR